MVLDIHSVRSQFPILSESVHGKPLVYLDTAASAQKPLPVLEAMDDLAKHSYANVKRSAHVLAEKSTLAFEDARKNIAQFLNASSEEIIFTSGTTDAINRCARMVEPTIFSDDEILVSISEHHSNFVPWQQIAKIRGAKFRPIPLTPDFRLDMAWLERSLSPKTKIVAIAHVSNVLGTIFPIADIARLLREKSPDALLIVDGAQAVSHMPVDVVALDVDFYAFSGHKLYGPTGIGVLYGKRLHLGRFEPPSWGGEMVDQVTVEKTSWAPPPAKFEPGTPNILGAIGLSHAVTWLQSFGFETIRAHERDLLSSALFSFSEIPGVAIIGPQMTEERLGCIALHVQDWHPHDLSAVLDSAGIATRAGHHCAQPLHCALGIDATVRISIGIYTTKEEIAFVAEAIRHATTDKTDPSIIFEGALDERQQVTRDDIMDHALHPKNYRIIDGVEPVLGKNPNCGDTVIVYVKTKDGVIEDISFQGKGCAISQASMSKLTKSLRGKSVLDIQTLSLSFISELIGLDFSSMPVRAKCAMLGLRAVQESLRKTEEYT